MVIQLYRAVLALSTAEVVKPGQYGAGAQRINSLHSIEVMGNECALQMHVRLHPLS